MPWAALKIVGAGENAVLAFASSASAAALSAGGWWAARDTRSPRVERTWPRRQTEPIVVGPLPREPLGFQQRTELVNAVDQAMQRDLVAVVCALTGVRGVGKTQLAGAYARSRLKAGWPVVAWIVAEEPGQVVAGLDELAEAAGIKGGIQDAELAAAAARRWLEQLEDPSLVVLDNVLDPDEVARWLPRTGQSRTLITSTVRSVSHLGTAVDIETFTLKEAVAFLQETAGGGGDDAATVRGATELAEELGCLPLALAQAAGVIRSQGLSFSEYQRRFRRRQVVHVMRRTPGEPYPNGVAQSLLLAIRQVESGHDAPAVSRVIEFMSLLSPSGVDRNDLKTALAGLEAEEIDRVMGALADASVVSLSLDGTVVLMHRLVQRIVRDRLLEQGQLSTRIVEAATALQSLLDTADARARREAADRGLTDHILALWASAEPLDHETRHALMDLHRAAVNLLVERAEVRRACTVGQDVLAEHERLAAPQDDRILGAKSALAQAYLMAGHYELAVPLREQYVTAYQERYGRDDPHTLDAVNTLGYVLESAGKLDEAEALHRRNLQDSLRVNGPDHQTTMRAQVNLASTLRSKGESEAALALFEQNATDNERAMGADHPSTANARGELARMYERVGRHTESLALYDQVTAHLARTGQDLTLWWGRHQARALVSSGRADEGISQLELLLHRAEQSLGQDHPETVCVRLFLARAHSMTGHHTTALAHFATCVSDRQRILGLDHYETLNARRNLGLALAAAGKRTRAISCLTEVLAHYQRTLPPQHPYTTSARTSLAAAQATPRTLIFRRSTPGIRL